MRRFTTRWLRPLVFSLLVSLIGMLLAGTDVRAQDQPPAQNAVSVYMFWGEGCPHCALAKPYLESLPQQYPGVELRFYEIWNNVENQQLFQKFAAAAGFEARYVPTIFIGDRHWEGYNPAINHEIESAIQNCLKNACPDPAAGVLYPAATAAPTPAGEAAPTPAAPGSSQISLPLIGAVDLSRQSLVVSTALIAFVDGFNPCSIWVLTMLLALTLHTSS
ncbi:MAG: thioredoxin family protein, partial [Chloroflexota bacterium]